MLNLQLIRRVCILIVNLFLAGISNGQTVKQIFDLIDRRKPDSAILIAETIISQDKSNSTAYFGIGRSYMMKGDLAGAKYYFDKAQSLPNAPSSTKTWSTHDLGLCFYYLGNYQEAGNYLSKAIKFESTRNFKEAANLNYIKLGFHDLYKSWFHTETQNLKFHFQDTSLLNIKEYIRAKESAYKKINVFFGVQLPKKIDYFVWKDVSQAERLLKVPIANTDPVLCLTHTSPGHTLGHEIVHSLSFHAVKLIKKHKLIAEGVCVYFDLSPTNDVLFKKSDSPISITRIWKNEQSIAENDLYFIGGQLVKRLIEEHGREKFFHLLADQSFENAVRIYGTDLHKIITDTENLINR